MWTEPCPWCAMAVSVDKYHQFVDDFFSGRRLVSCVLNKTVMCWYFGFYKGALVWMTSNNSVFLTVAVIKLSFLSKPSASMVSFYR
jgi:hypothetical protein